MADTKISALTADADPQPGDLLVTVDDPGGTPLSKYATIQNMLKATNALTALGAAPASTDILLMVDDPSGTPVPKKVTVAELVGYLVTTAGDTLYATAAATLARLAIGTAGQVFAVNSGATAPEWMDPPLTPNLLFIKAQPPASSDATTAYHAGASTPNEQFQVWLYDDTALEYMDFVCRLTNYGGGGLTLKIYWLAATATTNECFWQAAIRRIGDDIEDLDVSHTYDYNGVLATAPSALGEVDYATITFTDGVDMDSLADGELCILRIRRLANDGGDDMTGDAKLLGWVGYET